MIKPLAAFLIISLITTPVAAQRPTVGSTTLVAPLSTTVPLSIVGAVGQASDLTQWKDAIGRIVARVRSDGSISAPVFDNAAAIPNSLAAWNSSNTLTALGAATNGQLPIGSTGALPVLATLTGTANQITVTNGAGSITLSTPQNIDTAAVLQFARLGMGAPADATRPLAVKATSATQGMFYGYSVDDATAGDAYGSIQIGNHASIYSRLDYSAAGLTTLRLDSAYDDAGAVMVFRMRTSGTPVNALSIAGSGTVSIGNFQVNSSGNVIKLNNVTQSWPGTQGAAGALLANDGSGGLTWAKFNGMPLFGGTAPTVGTCGMTPSLATGATNNAGTVNVGSGAVTSCTVNFGQNFTNVPACVVSDNSTSVTGDVSAVSVSSFTASFSISLGSGQLYYHCF